MEEQWVTFDVLELIPKKSWPRKVVKRFFEINPLGHIRYVDNLSRTPQYRDIKHVQIGEARYFYVCVGYSAGNMVYAKFPVKDLIRRFFGKLQ